MREQVVDVSHKALYSLVIGPAPNAAPLQYSRDEG
jgi:hypothetical protein